LSCCLLLNLDICYSSNEQAHVILQSERSKIPVQRLVLRL
jgi:hypothetical protein